MLRWLLYGWPAERSALLWLDFARQQAPSSTHSLYYRCFCAFVRRNAAKIICNANVRSTFGPAHEWTIHQRNIETWKRRTERSSVVGAHDANVLHIGTHYIQIPHQIIFKWIIIIVRCVVPTAYAIHTHTHIQHRQQAEIVVAVAAILAMVHDE